MQCFIGDYTGSLNDPPPVHPLSVSHSIQTYAHRNVKETSTGSQCPTPSFTQAAKTYSSPKLLTEFWPSCWKSSCTVLGESSIVVERSRVRIQLHCLLEEGNLIFKEIQNITIAISFPVLDPWLQNQVFLSHLVQLTYSQWGDLKVHFLETSVTGLKSVHWILGCLSP